MVAGFQQRKTDMFGNPIDTGVSSATGAAQPGDMSGQFGTAAAARAGAGFGGPGAMGTGASMGTGNWSEPVVTKGGPGLLNNGQYGVTQEENQPTAFWRDYLNQVAGTPGFSSAENFLSSTFRDPAGLMMALSPNNTQNMQSQAGQLNAMQSLAKLVGGPAANFSPQEIIRSALTQIANYDPKTGKGGPGSALGAQLYDPDPNVMAQNISKFFGTVLAGIVPDRVLNGIMNTISIVIDNLGAKARQGSNSTGGPMIDSNQIANAIQGALHQFGVI